MYRPKKEKKISRGDLFEGLPKKEKNKTPPLKKCPKGFKVCKCDKKIIKCVKKSSKCDKKPPIIGKVKYGIV